MKSENKSGFHAGGQRGNKVKAAKDPTRPGRVAEQATCYGASNLAQGRAWARNWKRAGKELERVRAVELAAMTENEARQAMLDLFELRIPPRDAPDSSGLVAQQRLFARFRRKRGERGRRR